MENEQLLIGMARFFICGWLVFAQPLFRHGKYCIFHQLLTIHTYRGLGIRIGTRMIAILSSFENIL
jgi:hypothetical protein